uniref:Uncharacterized protein n=1 Tax=Oryza sativa subsp. japonica TaxID=39947 RepID=Q5JJR6_ORYSJ|nr:hypothetical protein [Oryza sativa Japonica Group]
MTTVNIVLSMLLCLTHSIQCTHLGANGLCQLLVQMLQGSKGLFGTAPAPAPALLELELSQTVSAPPKLGVELGGALTQNELELWSWVYAAPQLHSRPNS